MVRPAFVYVGYVELGFCGDQEELAGEDAFFVGQVGGAGGFACVQDGQQFLQHAEFGLGFGVAGFG